MTIILASSNRPPMKTFTSRGKTIEMAQESHWARIRHQSLKLQESRWIIPQCWISRWMCRQPEHSHCWIRCLWSKTSKKPWTWWKSMIRWKSSNNRCRASTCLKSKKHKHNKHRTEGSRKSSKTPRPRTCAWLLIVNETTYSSFVELLRVKQQAQSWTNWPSTTPPDPRNRSQSKNRPGLPDSRISAYL